MNSKLVVVEEHITLYITLYSLPNRLENESADHVAWCNLAKRSVPLQFNAIRYEMKQ